MSTSNDIDSLTLFCNMCADDERKVMEYPEEPYEDYSALTKQVGGSHYKKFKIQPAEFCYVNNIPYLEATAIKYLCRWRDKGGFQDLDKAIHFIELLKELENATHTGRT